MNEKFGCTDTFGRSKSASEEQLVEQCHAREVFVKNDIMILTGTR